MVRIFLALAAAAGTLLIGRAVYAREKNQPMCLPLTVRVGVVLLAVYITIALSV